MQAGSDDRPARPGRPRPGPGCCRPSRTRGRHLRRPRLREFTRGESDPGIPEGRAGRQGPRRCADRRAPPAAVRARRPDPRPRRRPPPARATRRRLVRPAAPGLAARLLPRLRRRRGRRLHHLTAMGQNTGHHARDAGQVGQAGQALEALRMHRAGDSHRTIAAALGVGKSTIARWLTDALDAPQKALDRAARDYRLETHEWIDKGRDANVDQLDTPGAANVVLRATENVARLEGLYAAPVPQPAAAAAWATAQVIIEHRDGSFSAGNHGEVIDETRHHIVVRDDLMPPPTRQANETPTEYNARCM